MSLTAHMVGMWDCIVGMSGLACLYGPRHFLLSQWTIRSN